MTYGTFALPHMAVGSDGLLLCSMTHNCRSDDQAILLSAGLFLLKWRMRRFTADGLPGLASDGCFPHTR